MADTPAWVTLTAVAVTGVLSIFGNQLVESRKARNAQASAEQDARRAYEYEARKRLYTEAEPIFFELYEHAYSAIRRISNLAQATRGGNIRKGGWLSQQYYRASTIYRLLVPLATYQLLRERVTLLDLSLDTELERRYELARAAYRAFELDFRLANEEPVIAYHPDRGPIDGSPGELMAGVRQGVVSAELERAVGALIVNAHGKSRLMTYTEFEDEFHETNSRLRRNIAQVTALFDEEFTPSTRPVLWRVLVAQYVVYRAIRLSRNRSITDDRLLELVAVAPVPEENLRFSRSPGDEPLFEETWKIGVKYLRDSLEAR